MKDPYNTMTKRKRTKGQTMIYHYKTIHRKLKIEQHESPLKPGVNSGTGTKSAIPLNI
jgi:hypothetical protein